AFRNWSLRKSYQEITRLEAKAHSSKRRKTNMAKEFVKKTIETVEQ
ncbi:17739_t:CDS:2, partial [Cetraspora pellucida]